MCANTISIENIIIILNGTDANTYDTDGCNKDRFVHRISSREQFYTMFLFLVSLVRHIQNVFRVLCQFFSECCEVRWNEQQRVATPCRWKSYNGAFKVNEYCRTSRRCAYAKYSAKKYRNNFRTRINVQFTYYLVAVSGLVSLGNETVCQTYIVNTVKTPINCFELFDVV